MNSITFFSFIFSALTVAFLTAAAFQHLKFKEFLAVQYGLAALVLLCSCIGMFLGNPGYRSDIFIVYGVVCMLGSLCWMETFLIYRPFYYDVIGVSILALGLVLFMFGL